MEKPAAPLPIARPGVLSEPTAVDCLRCTLVGRRRLLCAKADACRSLPRMIPIAPVLLALWLGTAIAFYLTVR